MKKSELLQHSKCDNCGDKILAAGMPLFWTMRIERYGVDLNKARRSDAFAAFIGNSMIADAMGPNEDIAIPMMEPKTVTLCERCAMGGCNVAALGLRE